MSAIEGLDPAGLVDRYGERMFALARRLTGNDADAEDVAQNALLRAVQNIGSYRGESAPMGWLYRITLNEARELFRRRKRRPTVSLDALPLDFDTSGHLQRDVVDFTRRSERSSLLGEVEARVRDAIEELPDGYREAVVLKDLHGLSYRDSAELMELTIAGFKTRLHRARMFLRGRLEEFWNSVGTPASSGEES